MVKYGGEIYIAIAYSLLGRGMFDKKKKPSKVPFQWIKCDRVPYM